MARRTWTCMGLCLLVLLSCSCRQKPKNILLITVDTCRADHLGCYGARNIQTPRMDALAAEGALFEQCSSQVPITLPSHASLLTGICPNALGMKDNGEGLLSESATSLAEVFSAAGIKTGAFVSAFCLDSAFGLSQGFQDYDGVEGGSVTQNIEEWRNLSPERTADKVTDAALSWVQKTQGRFFLWVHYFDPHADYQPPTPFREDYRAMPYDGEIAFVDREVGRLFDELKNKKMWDETLVILTSDHGEDLGDHGEGTHSIYLYDSTLRVPLLVKWAGKVKPGTRVKEMVRLIDLFPTCLDIMGLRPRKVDGRSLVPALQGKTLDPVHSYSESYAGRLHFGWSELRGIRTDEWKLIHCPVKELYNLTKDPIESENVAALYPDKVAELESLLDPHIQQDRVTEEGMVVDELTRQKLEALGYLGPSGGGSGVNATGVIPKDMAPALRHISEGRNRVRLVNGIQDPQMRVSMLRQAASSLGMALQMDPANPEIGLDLAVCLIRLGRLKDALVLSKEVAAYHPQFSNAWNIQASCFSFMRQHEEALVALDKAIELDPSLMSTRLNKILLLKALGRQAEAEALAQGLKQQGASPEMVDKMLAVPTPQPLATLQPTP